MTTTYNPEFSFAELEEAQNQPEVPTNFGMRLLSAALGGQKTINFSSDANYSLVATDPPASTDDWFYSHIVMTDGGTVLTGGVDVIYPNVDALLGGGPSRAQFRFTNSTAQTLTVKRTGQAGVAVAAGQTVTLRHNGTDIELVTGNETVIIQMACSDLSTALSAATGVGYARSPRGFVLQEVRASLFGADSSDPIVVDINKNGSTVLSTKITIEQGDKTSLEASTANQPVISDANFADDDEITVDHDSGGTDAVGLVVTLIGTSTD